MEMLKWAEGHTSYIMLKMYLPSFFDTQKSQRPKPPNIRAL